MQNLGLHLEGGLLVEHLRALDWQHPLPAALPPAAASPGRSVEVQALSLIHISEPTRLALI
eukprot:3706358-Alexandrium_andersonii.AAC.1